MKKIFLNTILAITFAASFGAASNQTDFSSFQLGYSESFVEDEYVEYPQFIIRLSNPVHAENLVLDHSIRRSIRAGQEYQPRNTNFDMPTNREIVDAVQSLENIYQETGFKLHVSDAFNGMQVVSAVNAEDYTVEEIFNALKNSQYIDSVVFESITMNKTINTESKSVGVRDMSQQVSGDVGVMNVITPTFFNDKFYPEQAVFARQSKSNLGTHSAEAAHRLLRDEGIFDSGRKINVAVLDSGRIDHEDLVWAESADLKYTRNGETIYLNYAPYKETEYRTYEQSPYTADDCSVYWNESGGFDSDQDEIDFGKCADENARDRIGYSVYPVEDFCFTATEPDINGNTYECNRDDFKPWDTTRGYAFAGQHGLNVAGLIAAKSNNNMGIAGLIPHENVNLTSGLVVDENGGGNVFKGILWAIGELDHHFVQPSQYPADVINMSFGGVQACTSGLSTYNPIQQAYERGTVVVAAAGNESYLTSSINPASCGQILTVGALTNSGEITSFSNFGLKTDVMALGQSVSTLGVRDTATDRIADGDLESVYVLSAGTSFASPITASLAGLLKLINPDYTADEVYSIIEKTSTNMDRGYGDAETTCSILGCGNGSINFENAVSYALYNEMVEKPVAKHFLADTATMDNAQAISQMADFAPVCDRLQVKEGVVFSESGDTTINLYGANQGSDFELISQGNDANFIFEDTHSDYQVEVCSSVNGRCSAKTNVEVDRAYSPSICN